MFGLSGVFVKRRARSAAMLSLGLLGLSLSTAAYSWSYCALEDDVCKVNGQAVVRYGANGQYAYRQVTGPVLCSNQNFGDPAPKQPKECAVNYHPNALREAAGQRGGVPYPDTPGYPSGNATAPIAGGGEWRTCAMEDEFCTFRGQAEVRFGAEGRYHVRTAVDGVQCHVREFGDPQDGMKKHCQYRTLSGTPYKGSYNTAPPPAAGVANNTQSWRMCAEEDGLCTPPRNATVRFGAQGRYAYAERVQGSLPCNIYTFGDPIKGTRKTCEYTAGR